MFHFFNFKQILKSIFLLFLQENKGNPRQSSCNECVFFERASAKYCLRVVAGNTERAQFPLSSDSPTTFRVNSTARTTPPPPTPYPPPTPRRQHILCHNLSTHSVWRMCMLKTKVFLTDVFSGII